MMTNRIVLVGSPGVGKSCFLMLVAFYLACVKKERVVVIRKLKLGGVDNAVVYLDGRGHFARQANVLPVDLGDIRKMLMGANFLLDGFTQAEVNDRPELRPFNILATSCQFDCKGDDSAKVVVLPAWQMDDLLTYATWTSWVVDAGLRQTKFAVPTRKKHEIDPILAQLAMEQYFFSGGSMREFCRIRQELKIKLRGVSKLIGRSQASELVYAFGPVRSSDQVDRVSRHYVTDPSNADHYIDSTFWTVAVDSGYALRLLGQHATMELHGQLYTYAKSIGGGFEGIAYEQLFHRAVAQSVTSTPTVPGTPVVINATADAVTNDLAVTSTPAVTSSTAVANAVVKTNRVLLVALAPSEYTRLEICASKLKCSGENETECHKFLLGLDAETYWHPEFLSFPFIDAVAPCDAYRADGTGADPVLALLQVTIRNEKEFNRKHWKKLNDVLNKNTSFAGRKRIFVAVVPVMAFNLKNKPADVPFVATCFDPSPFAPQPAPVEIIQS